MDPIIRLIEACQCVIAGGTTWESADEQVPQVALRGRRFGAGECRLEEERTGSASLSLPRPFPQDLDEHAFR